MRTLLPVLLLGCTPSAKPPATTDGPIVDSGPVDDSGADDTAPTDDTGPSGDASCAPLDVTVTGTDVATVLRVRWRTEAPSTGRVVFSGGSARDLETPATAEGTTHERLLLGVTADTDVGLRVLSENANCSAASDELGARTGSLPAGLFPTRATGTAPWTGYQVLPLQGTGYAVVIIDNEGHYVWYHQVENSGNLMRAFLSADGEHVVLCHAGPQDALEEGRIVKVSLDGATETEIPFPFIDHDMTELPDGTIAAIVVEPRDGDQADRIVELHPDGTQTEIFNAWDEWSRAGLGVPDFQKNWTHGNAIDYDPVEDVYYVSFKAMESLVKIDRATGELLWGLNGLANEFAPIGFPGVEMHHQFEVLDGTILFFENGEPSRAVSRAVEVAIDEEARTVEEVWSYTADPPLYVFAKGDVHRFDDGITQVVWSSAGRIQNVTEAGDVVWQLDLELGQAMTFVQYVPSMYASLW